MFRTYDQNQPFLLPASLYDFVDEGHRAHLVNDLVEQLDLTALEGYYGNLGQPAYHPRLMLKVILYGFSVGIFSARKLQRACQENLAFKYLAGMETPAFRTFIEFRQRHREDMKAVFMQTVHLARALGLARLGTVALDGSKVEANTSKHKAMSYGHMLKEEKRLKAEIEKLLQTAEVTDEHEDEAYGPQADGYHVGEELSRRQQRLKKLVEAKAALEAREKREHPGEPIDPKKQISFADHDARCFTKPREGTRYVHNAQAAVDMDSQIIVANHIEDSVSDAHAAEPVLVNMEQEFDEVPRALVTDAGYGNQHTLDSCWKRGVKRGVTPVCATAREGKDDQETGKLDRFSYDRDQDRFVCPHGHAFVFTHECEGRRDNVPPGRSSAEVWRLKTVPPVAFNQERQNLIEGGLDVQGGDVPPCSQGLFRRRDERPRGGPSVRATPGHGAQDAQVLGTSRVSTRPTG